MYRCFKVSRSVSSVRTSSCDRSSILLSAEPPAPGPLFTYIPLLTRRRSHVIVVVVVVVVVIVVVVVVVVVVVCVVDMAKVIEAIRIGTTMGAAIWGGRVSPHQYYIYCIVY